MTTPSRRALLGCIADDFTGATDLANMLVRGGMRTVQTIGVAASNDAVEAGRRDLFAIGAEGNGVDGADLVEFGDDAGGVGVENFRMPGRMHELKILRDEFEIDQPARGIFQVPLRILAVLLGDGLTHVGDVARDRLGVALAAEHVMDHPPDARGKFRRSRNHPGPGQR